VLKFYRAGKLNPAVWQDHAPIFALAENGRAIEAVGMRILVMPLVQLKV
jgi:hypothetical protein